MKIFSIIFMVLFFAQSCKKDVGEKEGSKPAVHPPMTYIDLSGKFLSVDQLTSVDLDSDNQADLRFKVQMLGDNINNRVQTQYIAASTVSCNLLYAIDSSTGVDIFPVFQKNDEISLNPGTGKIWINKSEAVLMQKVYTAGADAFSWERNWINKKHKYLALQLLKSNQIFNGWIELDSDTTLEKVVLYKAAFCKEAGKSIRAGYE